MRNKLFLFIYTRRVIANTFAQLSVDSVKQSLDIYEIASLLSVARNDIIDSKFYTEY